MKRARYICFEGTEGVGKTTQTNRLAEHLMAAGHKVLLTKEPGTPYAPLTMILRQVMLDRQYEEQLTPTARELVSQAIRSIHLEKVIEPAFENYDYIIQDRGMLSGLAYGVSCGNTEEFITNLMTQVSAKNFLYDGNPARFFRDPFKLYDDIVYLKGDVNAGLTKAINSKQEFTAGDAIEAKGLTFMQNVAVNMEAYSKKFQGSKYINVDGKNIEQVFEEIVRTLDLKDALNGKQNQA